MKSAVSRGVVVVSVMATLGFAAGCSDGDGGGGGKKPSKSAEAGTPSAEGKLESAALAAGDVKKYKLEKESAGSAGEARRPAGPVHPAECRPLSEMLKAAAPPKAKAHVSRVLSSTDVADTTATEVVLFAYGQADAEKTMDTLRTATKSKKCATFGEGGRRYFGVRPQPARGGGDEAVSYKLANRSGEFIDRSRVTVVRSGSTLIAFRAASVFDPEPVQADEESGDGMTADPKVSDAIVDAQLAKLAGAK
ncbi:hypothetical protein ACGFSB_17005 [Streptomyces sp. NPDC048441]|uniref:hypothetical protein n=1 Tax=Streptomyces sp. NPDC048441 TaxID=3365552 RepID=UPI00371911AE